MENITLETALDAFNVKDVAGMSDTQKKAFQQAAERLVQGPDAAALEKVETTLSQIKSVQNTGGVIDKYAASAAPGAIKEKATEIVEPMPDEVGQAQQDEIVKAQQFEEGLQRERKDLKDAGLLDEDEEQKTNQITNKNQSSSESSADKPAEHDQKAGAACTKCENLDPCIEKVVVTCHTGDGQTRNTRVTLKGGSLKGGSEKDGSTKYPCELVDTNGRIYFVAEKFESGMNTFENAMSGARLYDPTEIEITIAGNCPHKYHTVHWENPEDGLVTAKAGQTTTLKFRPMTKGFDERFALTSGMVTGMMNASLPKYVKVFEVLCMLFNILVRRPVMTSEREFYITYDGTKSFGFTSVTVPQFKVRGNINFGLPTLDERKVENSEGQERKKNFSKKFGKKGSKKSRIREINIKKCNMDAELFLTIGNYSETFNIINSDKETTSYDDRKTRDKKKNKRAQKSGFMKFFRLIADSGARFANTIPGISKDDADDKMFDIYSEGPTVNLDVGPTQEELKGKPELTWSFTIGFSLTYKVNFKFDIYAILLKFISADPKMKPLTLLLKKLEKKIDLGFAEGQIDPFIYLIFSIGIQPRGQQDGTTEDLASVTIDCLTGDLNGVIYATGVLGAEAAGGIKGYFESILTDKRVFEYSANIVTSGGITITIDDDKQGCNFWHNGFVVSVVGVKQATKAETKGTKTDNGNGRNANNSTVIEKGGTTWMKDHKNTRTYRIAGTYNGPFIRF